MRLGDYDFEKVMIFKIILHMFVLCLSYDFGKPGPPKSDVFFNSSIENIVRRESDQSLFLLHLHFPSSESDLKM